MHGQNFLMNQPLAIDKDYLLSLLPNIILGYKNNSFLSVEQTEENYLSALTGQFTQSRQTGADTFPVVLNISGPIVKHTDWNYIGTQTYLKILKNLENDPSVSGVILNIDSGGGMVSGTAELADFIHSMETPTIAYTNGLMCSAAQHIGAACDYKMASPYADAVGSIGTMLSFQDFSAMFEKFGAKIHEVYAPQSTEKNFEFRELLAGNKQPYEERLRVLNEDFIKNIKKFYGEKLTDDGHVFKGKTYNAQEALAIGLLDEVGTLEDALAKF